MMRNGSAPATARQAHQTMRTALNEAVRRGYLVRNPAMLAKAPRIAEKEVEPFSVDEVRLLLRARSVVGTVLGGPLRSHSVCVRGSARAEVA
jgi:integrase